MVGVALLLAAVLSTPGPYTLVNGTGSTLTIVSIRAADGHGRWTPLNEMLAPGQRRAMPSPGGELCAFDLRARIGSAEVTWTSVNLCDVQRVTLNRRPDGTLWVDYD